MPADLDHIKPFMGFCTAGTYILSCDTIFSIVNTIPVPRFITILNSSTAIIRVSSAPLIPFRDPSVPSASYPGATAQHASRNTFPLRHRSKRSLRQLGGWQKGFQLFLLLLGRQDFFLLVKRKKTKEKWACKIDLNFSKILEVWWGWMFATVPTHFPQWWLLSLAKTMPRFDCIVLF